MAYNNPTVTQFQEYFVRDFNYGNDPNYNVLESDIANAMVSTQVNFNSGFWPNQASYTLGFLLLTAHYMVLALRASSQGLNGQWNWAQAGKNVGAVSETFSVPERIQNNPYLMMLTKTNYGAQYLQLILPQLCGQMFLVQGGTVP